MMATLKLTAPPRQLLKSEGICIAFDQEDGFFYVAFTMPHKKKKMDLHLAQKN